MPRRCVPNVDPIGISRCSTEAPSHLSLLADVLSPGRYVTAGCFALKHNEGVIRPPRQATLGVHTGAAGDGGWLDLSCRARPSGKASRRAIERWAIRLPR